MIGNKYAKWTNTKKNNFALDKAELLRWTKTLIDNTFIQLGQSIVKQIKGIPMGTNAAPQIADMYLLALEIKYVKCLSLIHI